MKHGHQRTLAAVYSHPTSANIARKDVEALFRGLGAQIGEREGSRVAVVLFGEVRVCHRPHSSPHTDKGAIASIRRRLEQYGVKP
ncbi:MAG: type II toxin-antitoxin system HicA family toxin [Burkholderiales bacterium]